MAPYRKSDEDRALAAEPLVQTGRLVLAACTMLCQALSAHPAELTLQSVEPRTWPDTSLGLPQPGTVYAPVMTPGYVLRLQRGPDIFIFHAALQGPPVCAHLLPSPAFDADHPLIADAMLDLATRLQTPFSRIALEHAAMQGPAEPKEDPFQADVHTAGQPPHLHVVLRCGTRTYTYQGPLDRALTYRP